MRATKVVFIWKDKKGKLKNNIENAVLVVDYEVKAFKQLLTYLDYSDLEEGSVNLIDVNKKSDIIQYIKQLRHDKFTEIPADGWDSII